MPEGIGRPFNKKTKEVNKKVHDQLDDKVGKEMVSRANLKEDDFALSNRVKNKAFEKRLTAHKYNSQVTPGEFEYDYKGK